MAHTNTATADVAFTVTFMDDTSETEWIVSAPNPEVALDQVLALSGEPGIYSVWDPEDLFGMPVLERTIDRGTADAEEQMPLQPLTASDWIPSLTSAALTPLINHLDRVQ